MSRRLAILVALLGCLLQLAPAAPTAGTLAVTAVVAALALALLSCALVPSPVRVFRLPSRTLVAREEGGRQYVPAVAGRPQPRAPGCGR